MQPDNEYQPLARVMFFIMWLLIFVVLVVSFYYWEMTEHKVVTNINNETVSVTIYAYQASHYKVAGKINGENVKFLVDTGATLVSIPQNLKQRLGLKQGYPVKVKTANGAVTGHYTRIKQLDIGPIKLTNIKAILNPGDNGEDILLGMSALKYLELYQQDNKLTLKQQAP